MYFYYISCFVLKSNISFSVVTTTNTPNAKQTTAEDAGTSVEITKKTQTTEDAGASRLTSKKQTTTAKEATTSTDSGIMAQTTQGETTSVATAKTQTTEGRLQPVVTSLVKQGRRHRTD